jgi:hypothetical protein
MKKKTPIQKAKRALSGKTTRARLAIIEGSDKVKAMQPKKKAKAKTKPYKPPAKAVTERQKKIKAAAAADRRAIAAMKKKKKK